MHKSANFKMKSMNNRSKQQAGFKTIKSKTTESFPNQLYI